MKTLAYIVVIWLGCGVLFGIFLAWASGLLRQRREARRDWDAEFTEIVKELR